jgi:hypothetical protein
MNFEQKKRFMRESLHVSTREMPKGTINSFFKKLETIKRKYK